MWNLTQHWVRTIASNGLQNRRKWIINLLLCLASFLPKESSMGFPCYLKGEATTFSTHLANGCKMQMEIKHRGSETQRKALVAGRWDATHASLEKELATPTLLIRVCATSIRAVAKTKAGHHLSFFFFFCKSSSDLLWLVKTGTNTGLWSKRSDKDKLWKSKGYLLSAF